MYNVINYLLARLIKNLNRRRKQFQTRGMKIIQIKWICNIMFQNIRQNNKYIVPDLVLKISSLLYVSFHILIHRSKFIILFQIECFIVKLSNVV